MKKGKPKQMYNGLFREAERLTPSADLWSRIEAKVDLRSGNPASSGSGGKSIGHAYPPGHSERSGRSHSLGRSGRTLAFRQLGQRPWMRAAASVVLAVGLVGLGVSLKHKPNQITATPAENVRADAESAEQMDLVDPDLLGWHADLGEVDMEADEAEEVL
jgi:hypothetical protein